MTTPQTDAPTLQERLRKAKGSELLPKVLLGMFNAEHTCLHAADTLDAREATIAALVGDLEMFADESNWGWVDAGPVVGHVWTGDEFSQGSSPMDIARAAKAAALNAEEGDLAPRGEPARNSALHYSGQELAMLRDLMLTALIENGSQPIEQGINASGLYAKCGNGVAFAVALDFGSVMPCKIVGDWNETASPHVKRGLWF